MFSLRAWAVCRSSELELDIDRYRRSIMGVEMEALSPQGQGLGHFGKYFLFFIVSKSSAESVAKDSSG